MDISGLSKAEVLVALFHGSYPQRAFFSGVQIPRTMSVEEAEAILATGQTYFEVFRHHKMRIDLGGDQINVNDFNTLHGEGAAERAIERLRNKGV